MVAADAAEVVSSTGSPRSRRSTPTSTPRRRRSRRSGRSVKSADGVVFATPEYAFGLPGSLKNALDWLVGSGELYEKPVVVIERGAERRARCATPAPTSNARCARRVRRCSLRRRSRSRPRSRQGDRRSADPRSGEPRSRVVQCPLRALSVPRTCAGSRVLRRRGARSRRCGRSRRGRSRLPARAAVGSPSAPIAAPMRVKSSASSWNVS